MLNGPFEIVIETREGSYANAEHKEVSLNHIE